MSSEEGERFLAFYPEVATFPFVGVIDERTGELLLSIPVTDMGLENIQDQRLSSSLLELSVHVYPDRFRHHVLVSLQSCITSTVVRKIPELPVHLLRLQLNGKLQNLRMMRS